MQRRTVLRSATMAALAPFLPLAHQPPVQEPRWQPDGRGARALLGVITPDFDPVPESEIATIAPPAVSVHASRVFWNRQARSFADPPHVDSAVERLAELAPQMILFGFSSSSYAITRDEENALLARLAQLAPRSTILLTTLAAVAAMRALKVQRLAIMHPPWFSSEINAAAEAYYRGHGLDVVACARMTPARTFTEVAPAEVFERASALVPPTAEALLIGGNGRRAVGTIARLEASLKRPVLTANQVLAWAALSRLGLAGEVTNYGRVFQAAVVPR
jgi:maleate isomerase